MELAALYRDIVEKSPDAMWVYDHDGRTIYANPALRALFGAGEEEMKQLTVFDSLDDAGKVHFAAHLADLRAGRVNQSDVETQFVRRDGSVVWVLISETELRGPDGEFIGVLNRLSDYSDRRANLDNLATARRRLDEAQRIARMGSWEWEIREDRVWGSKGLRALYGLSADAFPATYADFLEMVHEEDRGTIDAVVREAIATAGEFKIAGRIRTQSDTWVWTRIRGECQTDLDGAVVSMSGTHQDITETKLADLALEDQVRQNALLQAIASAANEATTLVEVLRSARDLALVHDDWERARGFVPDETQDGLVALYTSDEDRTSDLQDPEPAAMEHALAERAYRTGELVWDDKKLTIAFPVSYAGRIYGVATITSAPPLYRYELIESMVRQVAVQLGRVAEREQAQRELADARDGAMEASRQKSEFLATMSHEIRTPLNGVIGLNDLLLRSALDPDQLRLASGVQVASRALLSVINDILDFSKIEAGKLELERLDFEIRPVFDQVASVLAEAARAKGLELIVSCHPDVPEMLAGDPTRLAQVLTNLGSNAVKFTQEGEVYIRATTEATEDGRHRLHVTVADTGVGVPEVDVDLLFEAFTQADASTTRKYGGTGLGLAICREIVDALGGEIGLEPNPGGGSIFWFTAFFEAPVGSAADANDEFARQHLAGRRVLVVDDNEHNRLIFQEQLAWWGVRSDAVVSADEAELALLGAMGIGDPFEAVLLDMSMPERDGLDLARAVHARATYDGLTMLMLTSATVPEAEVLHDAGIAECLTKPVLSGDLRSVLLRHVAGVEPRAAEQPAAAETAAAGRVLVVEDNPVNQLVAVGLLEALGYDATTADDGEDALVLLETETFDVVLMDVQMPRLDGYATTRAIRARECGGERLPVIAMTAAAVEGERDRCLAAGMDDFLTKPVNPSALAAMVSHWIGDETTEGTRSVMTVDTPNSGDERLARLALERLDELRDLDPGNTTYLDRAIGNFLANTPGTLESIRAAADAGDAETLKQVVHKLAGGALNLGVQGAGRTAQEIELIADTGTTDGTAELLAQLEAELELGRESLRAYQETYSSGSQA
ncbi:response regulator [Nocardioides sp. SR21]|uniref:response regulator n=1 Tax=Nocardioides sp. SR21 TaxID=2919501 RepID=UPI001FAA53AC|nr:response regulator [Nocardioides sp. SR21]